VLAGGVAGNEVAQTHGRQRYEAVVERIQQPPVRFEFGEDQRGHQEEDEADAHGELHIWNCSLFMIFMKRVKSSHQREMRQVGIDWLHALSLRGPDHEAQERVDWYQESLHGGGQHQEGHGDAHGCVGHAEELPLARQRCLMSVACE